MLEVLRLDDKFSYTLEKNNEGLIFISDKIYFEDLEDFTHAYYNEKCFFKNKDGQKIEIVKTTLGQVEACYELMQANLNVKCSCNKVPCPNVLAVLQKIFNIELFILSSPDLGYVVQIDKIYPILLACLRGVIPSKTVLYFTTSGISHLINTIETVN